MTHRALNEAKKEINRLLENQMYSEIFDFICSMNTRLGYATGRSDTGKESIEISGYPHDPKINVLKIEKSDTRLTYGRGLSILQQFEKEYNIDTHRLLLVCPAGYSKECLSLMSDGVLLKDKSYLTDLCTQVWGERDSVVDLLPHNERTYILLSEDIRSGKNTCTVQATGTGKRFLAAKLVNEYSDCRIFYFSPSTHINDQQAKLLQHLPRSRDASKPTFETMTYQSLLNMKPHKMRRLNADLIIVDEFHRCGATKWGKKLRSLLRQNRSAILVGTTATPIRYTDGSKDMARALFNSNIVTNLPLEVSITKGITPCPKFISGFYKSESVLNEELKKLLKVTPKNQQEAAKREFAQSTSHIQSSQNIEEIISKHISKIEGKYMIFCDSVAHLNDILPTVTKWFTNIAKKREIKGSVNLFHSHSKLSEKSNIEAIEAFDRCCSETDISVMLSINMYNEGLHLKGVSRVIQLRKTMSPIIFFQQIGRCLSVSGSETPVVFDLVDNANSVGLSIMRDSIQQCEEEVDEDRARKGLKKIKKKKGNLFDEVKPIVNEIEKITERLSRWSACYNAAIAFNQTCGHFDISENYVTGSGLPLGQWVVSVHKNHLNGTLTKNQLELLEDIKFPLTKIGVKVAKAYGTHFSQIDDAYCELSGEDAAGVSLLGLYVAKYKRLMGMHRDVNIENNPEWKELYEWLKNCRRKTLEGTIDPALDSKLKDFKIHLLRYTPSLSRPLKR